MALGMTEQLVLFGSETTLLETWGTIDDAMNGKLITEESSAKLHHIQCLLVSAAALLRSIPITERRADKESDQSDG